MIPITFACGHRLDWNDGDPAPVCPECGDRRIARVVAPAPRITGVVTHG
jgi:predicted RNA-binding Zn-ribbon protein involved in translation (DUF1610 family)